MTNKAFINSQGTVVEINGQWFKVKLEDTETIIRCYTAGKLRKANIKVILGDIVQVELDSSDLSLGRIVYRYRK